MNTFPASSQAEENPRPGVLPDQPGPAGSQPGRPEPESAAGSKQSASLRRFWNALARNPKALVGLIMIGFFVLMALFGPLFNHADPNGMSVDVLLPPSPQHWLGTTQTGQDVLAQMLVGTRSSILWGFATGIVVTLLSVAIGLTAGYFGRVIDDVLSLLINVFLVLPSFPLAIVLAAYIPFKGPATVAVVIALTSWAWNARVLRAQTLSMRNRDFVAAARSCGESAVRIIFLEIFPNELGIAAAAFISTTLYVILAAAGLEFLGLGDPGVVDWGTMFYWAQNSNALLIGAWWWFLPPGLGIALLGAGLALLNFGIDEIANPRLRKVRSQTIRRA